MKFRFYLKLLFYISANLALAIIPAKNKYTNHLEKYKEERKLFIIIKRDASKCFKELIKQIKNFKLNFAITKTPFSAKISIKRLLVRL